MTRSGISYGIEGPGLGVNEWDKAGQLLDEVIISNKYSFLPKSPIFSLLPMRTMLKWSLMCNTSQAPIRYWVLLLPGYWVPDTWFQSQGKATQGGLTIRPVSNDLLNLV